MHRRLVTDLLGAHRPVDAEEVAALAEVLRVFAETPASVDLFSKHQCSPGHVTTSAIVLDAALDHVLLIDHPGLGLWVQPGGHVDPSDGSPRAAALRELLEETGLDEGSVEPAAVDSPLADVAVHAVPDGLKGQPAHAHYDLRFGFRVRADTAVCLRSGDGVGGARWVPVDQLDRSGSQVHTDDSVRAAVRRLMMRARRA